MLFRSDRLMTTGQAKTKGLYLFWTMVDGRERNDLYGIYEGAIITSDVSLIIPLLCSACFLPARKQPYIMDSLAHRSLYFHPFICIFLLPFVLSRV